MSKKSLDRNDLALWKKVTETIIPMAGKKVTIDSNQGSAYPHPNNAGKRSKPVPIPVVAKPKPPLIPADLDIPGYGGISRTNARAMLSGKLNCTSKIDLHGLTLEDAQLELRQRLKTFARNGHRHVLVITGKGAEGKGVIRSNFRDWLKQPPLSELVIAYCQAQPKDGGGGAWYVNLRS